TAKNCHYILDPRVSGSIINYKLCHIFLFFLLLCSKWEFYRVYDTGLQLRKMTGSEEEVQKKRSKRRGPREKINRTNKSEFWTFLLGKHGLGAYL
ncbi:MAG TPA: hypothetical protein PKJ75_02945, partial [Methanosarcina vacuolata]|nr:hypothetical protein [Methanosarcina vacuolata]